MDEHHVDKEIMWASGKLGSGPQCCGDWYCHAELCYLLRASCSAAAVRQAVELQCSLLMRSVNMQTTPDAAISYELMTSE